MSIYDVPDDVPSNPNDYASLIEQRERDAAIQRTLATNTDKTLSPKGRCYNCDEKLESATCLFCDKDCREDWEWAEERKKINGRYL